jgi:predicted MFS family arabinose efflux permease
VFSWTLLLSLLYDLVPANQRASSVALFGVAGLITNPLASVAGEAILRNWGGPGLFLFAAAFALASWLWTYALREPDRPQEEIPPGHFHELLAQARLRPLFVLSFVFGVFFSALMSFLPHQTQQTLGEPNLSAFLVPFSVVSVALRVVMGPQLDRRPPRAFLLLSFASLTVAMGLLLLPPHWGWVILSGAIYGVGHSTLFPLLSALFVRVGGESQKAVYSNAYLVANLAGAVVMTPLLGAMGDLWGFASVAATLLVMALGCCLLVLMGFEKPEADRPSGHSS